MNKLEEFFGCKLVGQVFSIILSEREAGGSYTMNYSMSPSNVI